MDEKTAREDLLMMAKERGWIEGYHQGRRELINDPRITALAEYAKSWGEFSNGEQTAIKFLKDFEQLKKEIESK